MDKSLIGRICGIIGMVSVFAMFVWGMIEGTYAHAWLAPVAGGIACAIFGIIAAASGKKKEEPKEEPKDE